jgi:phosphoglycolate phosphatase-like HAD superfamily hydrolase
VKLALDLDAVLGDTRAVWQEWLEDAARRYRSIAALDLESLPDDRAAAATALDEWAEHGIGDWRSALERFAEDRAPLFFRRDPDVAAALRRLRGGGAEIGVFSDAPEPLVRVALDQLGASRQVTAVEAGARAKERLLERLGADARLIRTRGELLTAAT